MFNQQTYLKWTNEEIMGTKGKDINHYIKSLML